MSDYKLKGGGVLFDVIMDALKSKSVYMGCGCGKASKGMAFLGVHDYFANAKDRDLPVALFDCQDCGVIKQFSLRRLGIEVILPLSPVVDEKKDESISGHASDNKTVAKKKTKGR